MPSLRRGFAPISQSRQHQPAPPQTMVTISTKLSAAAPEGAQPILAPAVQCMLFEAEILNFQRSRQDCPAVNLDNRPQRFAAIILIIRHEMPLPPSPGRSLVATVIWEILRANWRDFRIPGELPKNLMGPQRISSRFHLWLSASRALLN